ncbi:MAG: anthranilate phosphoribosyltransferase [Candidatus Omnitrophota bacterium]
MIKEAIAAVVNGNDLSEREMSSVFGEIMSGKALPTQIASFITALRIKGETVAEITGAAKTMRSKGASIRIRGTVVDTCGTGGSGCRKFNISTAAAFVVAGCGVRVAKHGNRSVSGKCGSADVLEYLGVNLQVRPEAVKRCIERIGVGFLFAPVFHGAMKYAAGPRREIGVRTIFNILGPLSNPAGATGQVLGVYDPSLTEIMAKVLGNLGVKRAFVVHGADGLDEITITGKTRVSELRNGRASTYAVSPRDFGVRRVSAGAIRGGDAKRNAAIIRSVLCGARSPKRDMVVVNASAALVAAGAAKDFREGARLAGDSIDSRAAFKKLRELISYTAAKREPAK